MGVWMETDTYQEFHLEAFKTLSQIVEASTSSELVGPQLCSGKGGNLRESSAS